MGKSKSGNFFEDFSLDQVFIHATPRTITEGDAAIYTALTGSRFLLNSSVEAAKAVGYQGQLVDDLLLFHVAFGKTVDDISLNAVANLGYSDVCFITPVYIGDTISVSSKVIGLKENSTGKSGIVYVESKAVNQRDEIVLSWNRWVMVHKKDASAVITDSYVPELPEKVSLDKVYIGKHLDFSVVDLELSGSKARWVDYEVGERIDHRVGMTIDDTDHTLATKLYQNNARVHFDAIHMKASKFKQRLMYGGHVISVCRALSFNGLENALHVIGINGGSHVAPMFAGDTLYAVSEVIGKEELPGRDDVAALRIKTWGVKNQETEKIEQFYDAENKRYHEAVVLALDYTVLIPR